MATDQSEPSKGGNKIPEGPVTSSSLSRQKDEERDELTELPSHHGKPLLVASAPNPRTLFLCWRVGWPAAFHNGLPSGRCTQVRPPPPGK